ncbi:MAG: tetratricopeptide repeat protein [Vicinamibacterales bacterium]
MSPHLRALTALVFLILSAPSHPYLAEQGTLTPAVRSTAEQAWRGGRFDEVEKIAQAHPNDESMMVLRALVARARGDYARADQLLQPIASQNPTSDAALERGLLQLYIGQRTEGRRSLQLILLGDTRSARARDYLRAARAARALGRYEDANDLFREADRAAPNDAVVNSEWGDLFLEKYDRQNAAKSYQIALKTNSTFVPALLGMARALADENPPQAARLVEQVLKLNPREIGAHLLVAEMAADQDKKPEAREAAQKALALNPKSLEALSMQAALAYVEGKDQEHQETVAAALKINPVYGEIHRVIGSVTARAYRFDDAADMVRKGIALDRDNIRAYADLGAHLMRTGDEQNARRMLESAFKNDPYDAITKNLLDLLDRLEPFVTIREGDMVLRIDPDEAPVMREYAPALAREALTALVKTWEFTPPRRPILIEMFPRHDDFAVRTLGLPGMLGALGACFGRVVTLDSPKARDPGTFNWGDTLWHEMAHVITLQLSTQRLPRWLSEGISTFEEKRARQEWGREMDIPFARAIDRGRVLKLRDLNSGFMNPETISLAYYQASLVVEHLVDVYGQRKLRAFVESYADGIDTEAAIERAFSVDIDTLQKSFDGFVEQRFGALRKALATPDGLRPDMTSDQLKAIVAANPNSFEAQMALGDSLKESAPDAAIAAFEKAATLVPNAVGKDSPQALIAEVALGKGDKVRAAKALETLTAYDSSDVQSARRLATLIDGTKEPARLQTALKRAVAIDPFDAASHATLGRLALAAGQTPDAIRMFRVALGAGPLDRAGAHADLGEALAQAGQKADAKKHALEALEIAPTYTRAQDLLLKLIQGGY